MSKRPAPDAEPDGLGLSKGTPAKRSRVGSAEVEFDARRAAAVAEPLTSPTLPSRSDERGLPGSETGVQETAPSAIQNGAASSEINHRDEGQADDDDDQDGSLIPSVRLQHPQDGYRDLYLDTINRAVLDFDFEKLCSVTLSNINVYSCLVCGKYFQGRGARSPAYFHALEDDHHVWINMETKKVYVLPEGYEVKSGSLDDIRYVVDPTYTRTEVSRLDRSQATCWDLEGRPYTPGFVGLNNIKANDYVNVVVHALAHVGPLRNYMMIEDLKKRSQLAQRFSMLVRKIWNQKAFKAHVSPHELLQEIAERSHKRFNLTTQSDPADLLLWLINELHIGVGGSRSRPGSSIVQRIFQGRMEVQSEDMAPGGGPGSSKSEKVTRPFMVLTLELPAAPLFQDEVERNIIPQVPLTKLLSKYDGVQVQEGQSQRRRFRLQKPLPPFLILHIKRFGANKFVEERNRTIVTFNPRGLDMNPYVGSLDSDQEMKDIDAGKEGEDEAIYDLVANTTHEGVKIRDDSVSGEVEKKVWSVQLLDKSRDGWVEVQDLFVSPAASEMLFTRESYIQIWERRRR